LRSGVRTRQVSESQEKAAEGFIRGENPITHKRKKNAQHGQTLPAR